MIPAFLTNLAVGPLLSRAGKAIRGVPWQVWAALTLAIGLWFGMARFDAMLKAADAAGYQRARGEWQAAEQRYVEKALALKASVERLTRHTTLLLENRYAKDSAVAGALAGDLRVRGPGQAAAAQCPAHPGTAHPVPAGPTATGDPGPRAVDVGMATVSVPQGLATVPWSDLVAWGEVCDARARALILTQDAHAGWKQAWPKP